MRLKNLKRNLPKLLLLTTLLLPLFTVSGCLSLGTKSATYLTSREQIFFVPKGETFPIIDGEKRDEVIATEDMVVVHKGTYMDLTKEANNKALTGNKLDKKKMTIWGAVAGAIGVVVALLKKFKKK